jgi:hypothetical protein
MVSLLLRRFVLGRLDRNLLISYNDISRQNGSGKLAKKSGKVGTLVRSWFEEGAGERKGNEGVGPLICANLR